MEGLQIINGECARKMQWNGFMTKAAAQNNRTRIKTNEAEMYVLPMT